MAPCYEHFCSKCGEEFEDIYSMKASVPTVCLVCGEEGGVTRLVSLPAQGVVQLTGHDLKQKLVQEGKDLKRKALTNENTLANLVGEEKYQTKTAQLEKKTKELAKTPRIKRKKSQ